PFIEEIRNRQIKNFFATLLLSIGTPMICGGDEFRRTQNGNNNAYCHDTEMNWYDWSYLKQHKDIYRFAKLLIGFRKNHQAFRREDFFRGETDQNTEANPEAPDILWFDEHGNPPLWTSLGKVLVARINEHSKSENSSKVPIYSYLLAFNASPEAIQIQLPDDNTEDTWKRIVDTSLPAPHDFEENEYPALEAPHTYVMGPRSFVLLIAGH
ncbi:MAG: glycogen debranching enzyme, partial [Spirochaetota bacterium]